LSHLAGFFLKYPVAVAFQYILFGANIDAIPHNESPAIRTGQTRPAHRVSISHYRAGRIVGTAQGSSHVPPFL
jgi:hypothetical protein